MKKTFAVLLLACFLTIPAAVIWADEEKDHVCFRVLDANDDDVVTFEEFEKVYKDGQKSFDRADEDKDGKLTHDEYHTILGHGSV